MNQAMWTTVIFIVAYAPVDYLFYRGVFPGGSASQGFNNLSARWPLAFDVSYAAVAFCLWRHLRATGWRIW